MRFPISHFRLPISRVAACPVGRTAMMVLAFIALMRASPARGEDEPIPPQIQSTVDRGLEWLVHSQDPRTGGWNTTGGHSSAAVAVTSLAAMAFMARGHVPGQGPYGQNVTRAIDYVIASQQPDGLLAAPKLTQTMYDHGISTVMLCEAYGMLDEKRQTAAHGAISRAVRLILDAQEVEKPPEMRGGWRYAPDAHDSDISVSGWQLMALRGAANVGAAVPQSAIDNGIAYIKRCAVPAGAFAGGFRYAGTRVNSALTGVGITSLELLGQHHSKEALAGGDYLLRAGIGRSGLDDQGANEFYFYTVYYCSQAAWQLGGRYWESLTPAIRQSLISHQARDGSWAVPGLEAQGGEAYGTSMAILALTVPYRYLPIYQR